MSESSSPVLHVVTLTSGQGLIFACTYCLSYTCQRTLDTAYGYDALNVGLVLLSMGIGETLTLWIAEAD